MLRTLRRIRYWVRHRQSESDLSEEMEFHRAMTQRDLERSGLASKEAANAAGRALGNTTRGCEDSRAVWISPILESVIQDIRYGLRAMKRNPGLTCVAVLSLGLAIGATTAIFGISDAVFFRMLPVRDPESLFRLVQSNPRAPERFDESFSYVVFDRLRNGTRDAMDLIVAGYIGGTQVRLNPGDSSSEPLSYQWVSGNFFEVLGVRPAAGRLLSIADDTPHPDRAAAVISHRYWQQHFAGSPFIIGQSLHMLGRSFEIIGIVEGDFFGTEVGLVAQVWIPAVNREKKALEDPGWAWLRIFGRPKPGVSFEQAASRIASAHRSMGDHKPKGQPDTPLKVLAAAKGSSSLRGEYERPMQVVGVVVALVLLIACANVSNLLLARAIARRSEIAVRVSLGAGRLRLIRQMLTESLLIAGLATVFGALVAVFGTRWLVALLAPAEDPVRLVIGADARILGFAITICVFTTLIAGLWPAVRGSRLERDAFFGRKGPVSGFRAGKLLLTAQVAICLTLVLTAALFTATFRNLATLRPGFDRGQIVVAQTSMIGSLTPEQRRAWWSRTYGRLAALPGVEAVALSTPSVFEGNYWWGRIQIPGREAGGTRCYFLSISPGYLRTMGTRLLFGRDVTSSDLSHSGPSVAVVNEAFVRAFLGGELPVGKRFATPGSPEKLREIVGVVEDVKYDSLRTASPPMVYYPLADPEDSPTIQIRTKLSAADVSSLLRREFGDSTSLFRFRRIVAQNKLLDNTIVRERLLASVSGFFGTLALLLSAIGLFGITNYTVARRIPEIGIRMALGASMRGVLGLVFRDALMPVAIGIGAGLAFTLPAVRLTESLLFGLKPTDPVMAAASVAILVSVALLATILPARRAVRISPVEALRHE